jgi:hypothetical protein
VREMAAAGLAGVGGASERKRGKEYVIDEQERALMMTTKTRHEEGSIVRIGSVSGIVGALLAMVGNLLHPADRRPAGCGPNARPERDLGARW